MVLFTLKRILALRRHATGTNSAMTVAAGLAALPFSALAAGPLLVMGAAMTAGAVSKALRRKLRRRAKRKHRASLPTARLLPPGGERELVAARDSETLRPESERPVAQRQGVPDE